jgi:YbbR domain-containing protein
MERARYWLGVAKEYAKNYALENTSLKVLALMITAVLWLSVTSRPMSEVVLRNVRVELRNLAPDLAVSKYDNLTATVAVRGPRDILDTLNSSELSAIADMTGVEPGVRVIALKVDTGMLPANLDEPIIEPRTIRVTVERQIEREVVIKPRFDGDPAQGYQLLNWQVVPDKVEIVGASSQVRSVDDVSTETVSLAGKTSTFSQVVAIDIGSPNVNIKDNEGRKVSLTVIIGEVREERTLERVPVTLNGAPMGAAAHPNFVSVRVAGPRSLVQALTQSDVSAIVQYRKGQQGSRELQVDVNVPAYSEVRVVAVTPDVVRIRARERIPIR